MTSARRQRDLVAPTMFPFLAVLLCTMGALVVILMLVVASAQASARQAVDQRQFEVEAVESQVQLARDSFEKQLATGNLKLEKKRLALQHLENHIQELLGELKQLETTVALLDAEAQSEELSSSQQEISALEEQLSKAREDLKTKLEKPDGDKPIFAIIPYDGPNGTHRRPIYLECTEEGVTIQPEGISLNAEDLQPPYGPGNPLDAALRTIRTEFVPSNQAITSTAYPLLIVRPSGIQAYAAARAAMSGWDDQFGYELVDEELELVYPDSKPGLSRKIAQALELARERQAALVRAMPRKYRQFGGTAQWSGAGGGGGSWEGGYGADGPSGYDFEGSGGATPGEAWQASRGGYAANGAAGSSGQESWMSNPALGSGGDGPQANSGGDAVPASQIGTYFGNATSNSDAAMGDAQRNSAGPAGSGSDSGLADNLTAGTGVQSDRNSGGTSGSNSSEPNPGGSSSSAHSNSGSPGGSSSFGSQQMTAGGNQIAMPSFGTQGGGGAQAGQPPNGATQAGGASSSGSPQSGSPAGPASMALDRAVRETPNARPVAAERGRGWAWSQGPPTQTPVVRSIRVMCEHDRWIVLPDSNGRGTAETIDFDNRPEERAERLARIIHHRVDSWGLALTGGYWKPILLVEVAEGAQWRFDQLERLFEGSGLEVQRRAPFK